MSELLPVTVGRSPDLWESGELPDRSSTVSDIPTPKPPDRLKTSTLRSPPSVAPQSGVGNAAADRETDQTDRTDRPLLTVRGLTHHYSAGRDRVLAFAQINLDLHPRELVCLLGPSGCGKSSLLLAIAGLQRATAGEVRLKGQPIQEPQPSVGMVFQGPALLPWLTVTQNITWGLKLRRMPTIAKAVARSRAAEALASVGLGGVERAYPHQLSGGMAQRVALARALVRQPELLLLDEPFSALDAITRRSMQALLLQAIARYPAAVLMVTHDIDEALALGDRVVLMDRNPGRIRRQWILRSPPTDPNDRALRDPAAQGALRREILEELLTVIDPVVLPSIAGGVQP
ncbi:ABC transporter ATP-binding protein [Limnothrix sp. FACHB-881]|uniref:ABC transporter ATP-binding protein n=1 Tax=unclassified Limnothrix TaxID=2632864 RepID=UPI001683154B|nr:MULTISPECIES: ABC transporter ATP-binding protein [unclassified Limnothrix]MBD2552439.1 ABC transporter ATP-binding protein [Limnothrix sp. FACHB-708]MBD2590305.1 ABC transporter ATP-binding protein [Limnothrix sp. FACHB-406]MBD2634080.1 ABC transporter ATP-binding protein [Limnothrix sp. FACHB-881]